MKLVRLAQTSEQLSQALKDTEAQAEQASRDGDHERALAAYNRLLSEAPTYALGYQGRSRVYTALSDSERAWADLERACSLAPHNPDCWHERGSLSLANGDFEDALRDFRRALDVRPIAKTWLAIGQAHVELGDEFDAIEAFGKAYELDHRAVDALAARAKIFMSGACYVAALADYATCCVLEPTSAEYRVARGNAHYELGDYELAQRDYEEALTMERCLPEVSLNLGCVALDRDDTGAAIRHFNDAIELDSDYARAYLNRGLAQYFRGHDTAAEADLGRAAELDENDPDALFALGRLFARQRRYGEALERLSVALERCPDYVDELFEDETFAELRKLKTVKSMMRSAQDRIL